MPEAVCIVCGGGKSSPWEVCSSCKFDPRSSSESLVKSVYLSTGRFEEMDRKDNYRNELSNISIKIRSGELLEYETHDIMRLRDQLKFVNRIQWYEPWVAVLEFLVKYFLKIFLLLILIITFIRYINQL